MDKIVEQLRLVEQLECEIRGLKKKQERFERELETARRRAEQLMTSVTSPDTPFYLDGRVYWIHNGLQSKPFDGVVLDPISHVRRTGTGDAETVEDDAKLADE